MKKEMIITMEDIQVGDEVFGSDGEWHKVVDVLPIHVPDKMFRVHTSKGYIDCSGTHLWNLYKGDYFINSVEASVIADNFSMLKGCSIGKPNSDVKLLNIEEIEPKPSRCIVTDSNDHQFEIICETEEETTLDIDDFEIEIEERK